MTLSEFLDSPGVKRARISAPGFRELWLERRPNGVIAIDMVEAILPGDGAFIWLIHELVVIHGLPVIVDAVINHRFSFRLKRMGFTQVDSGDPTAPNFLFDPRNTD